ncbi:bifunctional DNA primase/polymerase [Kribbella sp. CA-293567]|uniref:bifunctional DNA primase/polymerase n=1 Tax=Kribbella sp. CA-293567 TaxID=3002436 RepID=UPI0022DD38CF|nr:bifunctional DNA primase/polymerase [Kribbella sp. CA-293567]WBQ05047.1 bifunctional DNA primase/polymerase [Kribbella sp. CA-293567]
MNNILTAALAAAGRGWPVFMLARSKRPLANCGVCRVDANHDPATCGHLTCHGFYAATTEPARIAALVAAVPYGQLAVRTGAVSDLLVVDVDPAHGGTTSMTHLMVEGLLPRTLRVVTGSGGQHLYYRHPGRPMPSRPMPGRRGIDIKADGGYVVLPPSIHHRTGLPYRWATTGSPDTTEMPRPLIDACLPAPADPSAKGTDPTPVRQSGGISYPDQLLAAHLDAVRRAGEGRRRTTLYGAARGVARMVAAGAIEYAAAVAALTGVGREAEQTEREIRAAIAGGFRDEGIAA